MADLPDNYNLHYNLGGYLKYELSDNMSGTLVPRGRVGEQAHGISQFIFSSSGTFDLYKFGNSFLSGTNNATVEELEDEEIHTYLNTYVTGSGVLTSGTISNFFADDGEYKLVNIAGRQIVRSTKDYYEIATYDSIFANKLAGVKLQSGTVTISGTLVNIVSSGTAESFDIITMLDQTGSTNVTLQNDNGELTVAGDMDITGDFTVAGTTYLQSVVTEVTDPILLLGAGTSASHTTDRGIEFKYYNGSVKSGFFGYNQDNERFVYLLDATNSSETITGTLGMIDVGGIYVSGSQKNNIWDTAYSWGDHSTAGYAASSHSHSLAHSSLTGIGTSDHHIRYTDTEAIDAIESLSLQSATSSDYVIFSGSSGLGKIAFSSLDENILTDIKTYVDNSVANSDTFAELNDVSVVPNENDFVVYSGSNWVDRTPAQVKDILGLGSTSSPTFDDVTITGTVTLSGDAIINETNATNNFTFQIGGTDIFSVTSEGIQMAGFPESDYEFLGDIDGGIRFEIQAGENLSKGDVVYISGALGDNTIVKKAKANSASTMPAFGLMLETVSNGNTGQVVTFGNLYGSGGAPLDTSTCTVGDVLYVSPTTAGEYTKTKPTGEGNLVQNIGKVIRVASSNGVIKVGGAGRTNDTPNLNDGKIFIGNASNQVTTASLNTKINDHLSGGTGVTYSNGVISIGQDVATTADVTFDSLTLTQTTTAPLSIATGSGFEIDFTGSTTANIRNASGDIFLLAGTGYSIGLGSNNTNSILTVASDGDVDIANNLTVTDDIVIGSQGLESWDSNYSAIEIGSTAIMGKDSATSDKDMYIMTNAYFDGAWKYKTTEDASLLKILNRAFTFQSAANGTADAGITWSTMATIDTSGLDVVGDITVSGNVDGVDIAARDHDAVTLVTTSHDYLSISTQAITLGAIDLTTDVTGVLPSANMDADTAHLSTAQTFTGAKQFNEDVTLYHSDNSATVNPILILKRDGTQSPQPSGEFGQIKFIAPSYQGTLDNEYAKITQGIAGTWYSNSGWAGKLLFNLKVYNGSSNTYLDILELNGGNSTTDPFVKVDADFTVTGDITVNGTVDGVDIAARDHDAVTLVTTSHDYLSISTQAITLGQIDISDDTNLVAGTNISLSGDTLNVDDAFLINSGDDTTSGKITAGGLISQNKTTTPDEIGDIKIARLHPTSPDTSAIGDIDNLETFILSKTDSGYGAGTNPASNNAFGVISLQTHNGNYFTQLGFDTSNNQLWVRSADNSTSWDSWTKIWNAGNDGAGSGLDADLLDGNHASAFALSGHTHAGDIEGVTAGSGLTGGGTTGTVTLDIGAGTGITVNADDIQISSTYAGQTSITTLGTIATGTWNGSVIASQYLDSDTAHLSTTQTFTGAKTFSANMIIQDSVNINFGTNSDAYLYHDDTNFNITNTKGDLIIKNDDSGGTHVVYMTLDASQDATVFSKDVLLDTNSDFKMGNSLTDFGLFVEYKDGGENSARIMFHEQVNETYLYGFTIMYDGNGTTSFDSGFNSTLSNGQWGFYGHDNSVQGALVMFGDRAATYVDFSSNQIRNATLATGTTWNGNVIASAYLDSDTAHLSGAQTFSGEKTFSSVINAEDGITVDNITINGNDITISETGTADVPQFKIDSAGHVNIALDRGSTSYDANLMFQTAGSTKWRLWLDGADTTLAIRDEAQSNDLVTFTSNSGMTIDGSLTLGTSTAVSSILDEDTMSSNSATALATQQSIKAYVDSQVATANELSELTDVSLGGSVANGDLLVYSGSPTDVWQNTTTLPGSYTIVGSSSEALTIGNGSSRRELKINSSTWPEITFFNAGTENVRIGSAQADTATYNTAEGDFYIYAPSTNKINLLVPEDGGSLKRNNGAITVWDSANDGTGSGLDADLLDGNHASAFALSGHTHASSATMYESYTDIGVGGQTAQSSLTVTTAPTDARVYVDGIKMRPNTNSTSWDYDFYRPSTTTIQFTADLPNGSVVAMEWIA